MSLISDTDYLIHSLRLNYLRHVDDPYGPRIISLNPSYSSNPYILASAMADTDRWPELAVPSSPLPSEDESNRVPGGAHGLKHTHTIMGPSRTGMYGMRVSGRRASAIKPSIRNSRLIKPESDQVLEEDLDEDNGAPPTGGSAEPESWIAVPQKNEPRDGGEGGQADGVGAGEKEPTAPEVQFVPKFTFKGAAEMEARRRQRMMARRVPPGAGVRLPIQPDPSLNPEISSSSSSESDDDLLAEDDEDDFDDMPVDDDDMDGDDFDPDFAATRTPGVTSDSASDALSLLSAGNSLSTSNPSGIPSSFHTSLNTGRIRPRPLSPVSEGRHSEEKATSERPRNTQEDGFSFEMVTPQKAPHSDSSTQTDSTKTKTRPTPRPSSSSSDSIFARVKVSPIRSGQSALTAMLASSTSNSSNPFSELYAKTSGRAEKDSISVQVFFPHAKKPAGKAMELKVRKDSSVEEVIGFALWSFWEEGWGPKLDEGLGGEDDPKRATKLSAVGWILRIAEEDGEVDEDFPSPDRTAKIAKFNFDAYAILEATTSQVQQNRTLEAKIQRRPSRIMAAKKKVEAPATTGLIPPPMNAGTSAVFGSTLGAASGLLSSSLGPSSSYGPQIFLRIRIADTVDAVHVSTTVQASSGMYMQEVLEAVCRKRKLMEPKEYALLLGDMSILIPLDRTVASLQGKTDLALVKRSMLPQLGIDEGKQRPVRTTDPNASIFKRMSEVPEVQYSSAMDYTAAYKKYTIYRKLPMLVGRQERTLAIDGAYIHIMPPTIKAKAVFESAKTASYHIKSVVTCQQSSKSSSTFKFVVYRDGNVKRYDFEAETPRHASEIVMTVRGMKAALERSGTIKHSRRSRHAG
ncbi:hypothetical protein JAAARDRAFT_56224 [Jaapia argillacea MUCL 33604]|uniref:Uncharacterized protein n=1 Tax=Jaapia argillacea MUCL 33604 TaxID=933084 RepID=A0A067PZR8_9AGAM|nr:hypothetical protein JAAARDRAFT_56224 [Jaapia argillacea MUCL 33604]